MKEGDLVKVLYWSLYPSDFSGVGLILKVWPSVIQGIAHIEVLWCGGEWAGQTKCHVPDDLEVINENR